MIAEVYDEPEEEGIILAFDMENGMTLSLFMDDNQAQEMINIIQNKLNARWNKNV